MRATARCLIIIVTIVSWIAISNHCALRALMAKSELASTCPFHSKPSKSHPKPATDCCKILRAVPTTPAEDPVPAIIDLFPVPAGAHQMALHEPPQISVTPLTLDTGPPGKTSFVELSRSLRAHAPPFRA